MPKHWYDFPYDPRICEHCGNPIVPKEGHKRREYMRRKFCSPECHGYYRAIKADEGKQSQAPREWEPNIRDLAERVLSDAADPAKFERNGQPDMDRWCRYVDAILGPAYRPNAATCVRIVDAWNRDDTAVARAKRMSSRGVAALRRAE